ncbi:MAG: glycosyltransferase [Crocinitomicaceae bacterium]|nr:glycosyltransferase [Crocinitomicaceae bacterium]
MSILYITNKPIYPIIDGGCYAMDSFLNSLLVCESKVKHLTISTQKHPFEFNQYPEKIQGKTSPEAVTLDTTFSSWKLIKSLIHNTSYNSDRFYSKAFLSKILSSIDETTTIIILESSYLLVYLQEIKKIFNGKVFVRTHNVEHLIWQDYVTSSQSFFKKVIYSFIKNRLKKFELSQLKLVDGIISISTKDALCFKNLGLTIPIHTVNVGIDQYYSNDSHLNFKANSFFFLGAFNWKPNKDAAELLIHQIFPLIQATIPNAVLHIAGTFMPDYFHGYSTNSIKIHGKVDDVTSFLLNAGTLVAPITSGSGIRIKILECLALGVPVIGTKTALKGLEESPAFCVNSTDDYVTFSKELNSNVQLINSYKINAINYIQQFHNKEIVTNKLKQILSGR